MKRRSVRHVPSFDQCESILSMSMVVVGTLPPSDPLAGYVPPIYPYYPTGHPTTIEIPGGTGTIYFPPNPPGGHGFVFP